MKYTKNIFKSLLIEVMVLSLLLVSCDKDKNYANPTNTTTKKQPVCSKIAYGFLFCKLLIIVTRGL